MEYQKPRLDSLDEARPGADAYLYLVAAHRQSFYRSDHRDPLPPLAACHDLKSMEKL
jgi:hypothetical protein